MEMVVWVYLRIWGKRWGGSGGDIKAGMPRYKVCCCSRGWAWVRLPQACVTNIKITLAKVLVVLELPVVVWLQCR